MFEKKLMNHALLYLINYNKNTLIILMKVRNHQLNIVIK